jgi:hypothetical protein
MEAKAPVYSPLDAFEPRFMTIAQLWSLAACLQQMRGRMDIPSAVVQVKLDAVLQALRTQ